MLPTVPTIRAPRFGRSWAIWKHKEAPPSALAAEALTLERILSDLVNRACAPTPAEIALMWQTAPPRMPIPPHP